MMRKSGPDEIGQVVTGEPCRVSLTLEPSELEALLARMLSCSTRRARSNEPRRSPTRCSPTRSRQGNGAAWCRVGARAAIGERCVETKFG